MSCMPLLATAVSLAGHKSLSAGKYEGKSFQERMEDRFPAFADKRSKKIIFVAHCLINQNARCNGSGNFPSSVPLIPAYLLANQIGIAQMPCPELGCLGLGREGLIYDQLSTVGARRYLRQIAEDMAYQIEQYRKHGFRVTAILGVDCSPSCGVNCHAYNGAQPGKGAFMEELAEVLAERGLEIPLIGVSDENPQEALERIQALDS